MFRRWRRRRADARLLGVKPRDVRRANRYARKLDALYDVHYSETTRR